MKRLMINHLAVGVCFVLLTVLGFLWYGYLFVEPWMEMVGLDMATAEANPPGIGIWITSVIATIVPLYTLAWLFVKLEVESLLQGGMYGFMAAFSFIFLSRMVGNMFANAPYALSWIEGGFDLVALTLAGAILGAWRKYTQ